MLTHICSWKLLIETWEGKDVMNDPGEMRRERNFAPLRFPQEYLEYVTIAMKRFSLEAYACSPNSGQTSIPPVAGAGASGDIGDGSSNDVNTTTSSRRSTRRQSVSASSLGTSPMMGLRRRQSNRQREEAGKWPAW